MGNPEHDRLDEVKAGVSDWRRWGTYLSERAWGTVREDYSPDGTAWDYFPHDHARSRAYRWNEDGLAGICDRHQLVCFAIALWNARDPILKERPFGLTNSEGNHGEDVKEYYFYLDSTPTHSYMKYLYKYPQAAYPYEDLVKTNRERNRLEMEYELIDTGVFDDNRYFDIFVEYAKSSPEELLIEISVYNRGSAAASLHVLPTLWFRNTWSWSRNPTPKPSLSQRDGQTIKASHPNLGERYLSCDRAVPWLFTENETNTQRLFNVQNHTPYVKDGIDASIVHGQTSAVNPGQTGTKVAAHYSLTIPAGGVQMLRLRLSDKQLSAPQEAFGPAFDQTLDTRRREADEFYGAVLPSQASEDTRLVMRQAFAGMLWSKQFYFYPVRDWIDDEILPPDCPQRVPARNREWFHLDSADILSMPDKWEYPWFAAWDLAFHCIVLAGVD